MLVCVCVEESRHCACYEIAGRVCVVSSSLEVLRGVIVLCRKSESASQEAVSVGMFVNPAYEGTMGHESSMPYGARSAVSNPVDHETTELDSPMTSINEWRMTLDSSATPGRALVGSAEDPELESDVPSAYMEVDDMSDKDVGLRSASDPHAYVRCGVSGWWTFIAL